MKYRLVFPCETALARFDSNNIGLNVQTLSEINPVTCLFIPVLSSEQFNQAGYP